MSTDFIAKVIFHSERSTVSSMTAISDSYRFVRTLFAKTGSVRPTEADPQLALSVVPLLVGWESDKIS